MVLKEIPPHIVDFRLRLEREVFENVPNAKLAVVSRAKGKCTVWSGGHEQFPGDYGHPRECASFEHALMALLRLGAQRSVPDEVVSVAKLASRYMNSKYKPGEYIKDEKGQVIFTVDDDKGWKVIELEE